MGIESCSCFMKTSVVLVRNLVPRAVRVAESRERNNIEAEVW